MDRDFPNRSTNLLIAILPALDEKSGELWSTYHSVHPSNVYPLNWLFQKTIFRP